jgi:integrase
VSGPSRSRLEVGGALGLRRSELAGLAWADLDFATRRLHVRQAQTDDTLDSTKSEDSDRQLVIDKGSAAVLAARRKAQLVERLAWDGVWTDSGRVFTREDGTPLRPPWISVRFGTVAARAGLPPIRFHDLRHGAASMLQMGGVASAASFGGSGERPPPAVQRAAPGQAESHDSPCTARDLGCHRPLAPSRTMMQPVRLQRIAA